jgi:hypothetical protein
VVGEERRWGREGEGKRWSRSGLWALEMLVIVEMGGKMKDCGLGAGRLVGPEKRDCNGLFICSWPLRGRETQGPCNVHAREREREKERDRQRKKWFDNQQLCVLPCVFWVPLNSEKTYILCHCKETPSHLRTFANKCPHAA